MRENAPVRRLLIPAAVLVAVVSCLAWMRWAPRRAPAGQPALQYLSSAPGGLDPLRAAVNAAQDRDRLVVLLSPT